MAQTKIRSSALDTGINAGQVVALDSQGRLPAVNGSLITGVVAQTTDATSLAGQNANFYTNASNMSAGTLPPARLSSRLQEILNLSSVGYLKLGATGDIITGNLSQTDIVDGLTFYPVSETREVATTGSITGGGTLAADMSLSLVNDVDSPGSNYIYGTNDVGTKGWYMSPTFFGMVTTNIFVSNTLDPVDLLPLQVDYQPGRYILEYYIRVMVPTESNLVFGFRSFNQVGTDFDMNSSGLFVSSLTSELTQLYLSNMMTVVCSTTGSDIITIRGTGFVNSGSTISVLPQIGQDVTTSLTTMVQEGSWIRVTRI